MTPASPLDSSRWPRQLCVVLAGYAFVGGTVSFLGWPLDLPALATWIPGGASTQPNTALAVTLAALALVLLAFRLRHAAAVCAAIVLLIGGATLTQWLTGLGFGIDAPLTYGREWGRKGLVYVGRMGLPGCFTLTLLGIALLLSALGGRRLRRRAPGIALVTLGVGVLSLTGQLYQADLLYSVPRATAIATQTATFIIALSAAVIALHPEAPPMRWLASPTTIGIIARRSVPTVVLAPIALGYLRLQGERVGLFDAAFGTALLVLLLIVLLGAVLWRGLASLSRHEAALLAAEERLQLAITVGDAATWDLDLRTGINIRSDSYYQLLGHDPVVARESGQDLWDSVIEPEDRPRVQGEWRRAIKARDLFRAEHRLCRADGGRIWVRAAGRFFYDDRGRAIRFVGAFVDVTEEKQAIEQLREADQRKDEFLAMLAHELRNPLAPVRNAVAVLKAKGPPMPELNWARDVIDRQVAQMARLIDDLLDTSRIRSGRIELQRARIELAAVVHGAVEASRPWIDQNEHRLTVEVPDAPVTLDGDFVRLSQVFCNLLNNAARYTPRGGRIALRATREPGFAVVRVQDNGIGIPADMLPRVFDMFTQVDRSIERSRGGLGLGLTLVKQLVELHGGTVEARSGGPGRGCEFTVRLPFAAEVAPALQPAQSGLPPVPSGRARRVLVVDDNQDAAQSLARLLQLQGHETATANDGLEGLRLAQQFRPDVALLDLGMPRLTGYDVAAAIRREPWGRDVLLVALTGWGQAQDRARSKAVGFDAHLVKPVAPETVLGVVDGCEAGVLTAAAAR
jgi:two-component system CheB/CheR fusion protein